MKINDKPSIEGKLQCSNLKRKKSSLKRVLKLFIVTLLKILSLSIFLICFNFYIIFPNCC